MRMFRPLLMGEGQLPDEYTRINWIQSDKNQYLDLGAISTSGVHRFSVDMLLPTATNQATTVFGGRHDTPVIRRLGNMYFNQQMSQGIWIGTSVGLLTQAHTVNQRFQYSIEVDEPTQTITTDYNGLIRSAPFTGSTITPGSIFLFGVNLNGSPSERGTFRVFGFRIWIDGIFARDLIPVIDRFNEPLMFCNTTQTAYRNKGTTPFTWG